MDPKAIGEKRAVLDVMEHKVIHEYSFAFCSSRSSNHGNQQSRKSGNFTVSKECEFQGTQWSGAPLLEFLSFWGLSPPKFLYQFCFSKYTNLACNILYGIAMMNFLTAAWLLRS